MKANYRKLNDGSHNSSTFHKKDGTPVRAILRDDLRKIVNTTVIEQATQTESGNTCAIDSGCGKD